MSTTWSTLNYPPSSQNEGLAVKAVCTTGTETKSASDPATDGLGLSLAVDGFEVMVESAGSAFTVGSLLAWVYSPLLNNGNGAWMRDPDLDLSVQALTAQAYQGFTVPCRRGRIAFVPSGLGQACNIYMIASVRRWQQR